MAVTLETVPETGKFYMTGSIGFEPFESPAKLLTEDAARADFERLRLDVQARVEAGECRHGYHHGTLRRTTDDGDVAVDSFCFFVDPYGEWY